MHQNAVQPGLADFLWKGQGTAVAVPGYGTLLPPIFLIRLTEATLNAFDFAANGIAFPLQIQRSVARRQKEFFYGRLAAKWGLHARSAPVTNIPIGPAREPLWPDGFVGSITHNRDFAAALVVPKAGWAGVGIDVEVVGAAEEVEAMRRLVVSPGELSYLADLAERFPQVQLSTLLTIVFSTKESLYKAAYAEVGRIFDFTDVHVAHFDVNSQYLLLTIQTDLSPRFARDSKWRIHFDMLTPDTVISAIVW